MKKSEVYSWRVNPDMKAALEDAARSEGISVAKLLDRIVSRWLSENASDHVGEESQRRLRAAAAACFGAVRGGDPLRSQKARDRVRARLHERRGRS